MILINVIKIYLNGFLMIRAGPEILLPGGGGRGTGSRSLEPSGESREGVGGEYEMGWHPLSLWGAGGLPRKIL